MIVRLSGGSNPFTTPSGLTLYVAADVLTPEAAKAEASRICREAEAEMHRQIDIYQEWRWQRFSEFLRTGK
jgi:hypothetical protein